VRRTGLNGILWENQSTVMSVLRYFVPWRGYSYTYGHYVKARYDPASGFFG
jgi:hypothetical protein